MRTQSRPAYVFNLANGYRYAIVINPGRDDQEVDGYAADIISAMNRKEALHGYDVDIMRVMPDGALTTEW